MFSSYIRFYKGESLARSSEILFLSRTLHQQESKIDQPTRCTMVQKLKFRFETNHKPITFRFSNKVEKILKGSLDSIPSPSPSVKIQIMGGKVCLKCKSKTLLDLVNKLLKIKSLLTSPSNVLPYYLK